VRLAKRAKVTDRRFHDLADKSFNVGIRVRQGHPVNLRSVFGWF